MNALLVLSLSQSLIDTLTSICFYRGTKNVHVIGAAAFPAPVRCNPMATCYTMGWRLGELLAASPDGTHNS
jgi:choline dehydrogenase-like flavoprotein